MKIKFLKNALWINNLFVIGDLHLGYEEHLNNQIRFQMKEIIEELDNNFNLLKKENKKINKIILIGDLKHEFGKVSNSEWSETLKFIDYLLTKTLPIILIKGNHDNFLNLIVKKRKIKLKEYYKRKGICFLHGDKIQRKCLEKTNVLVIGHLHPAITLKDKYKQEKFKCFLIGRWKSKKVYILPSFSSINLGYNLNEIGSNKDFSIIPNNILKKFEVIIFNEKENKSYNFGRLKKLI